MTTQSNNNPAVTPAADPAIAPVVQPEVAQPKKDEAPKVEVVNKK